MTATALTSQSIRVTRNKVPEATGQFWLIRIACIPVGQGWVRFAQHTLRFGLPTTTIVSCAAVAVALLAQFRRNRYVPTTYWITVLLAGVVADLITDARAEPLSMSTMTLGVLLAIVLAVWHSREQTLSIYSIITRRREAFYWLTVLIASALGSAAGKWTLTLSGWGPGSSVILPAALLASLLCAWRLGASPVLCFWSAIALSVPLSSNIGAFLSASHAAGGLDLGMLTTTMLFGSIMFIAIGYVSISKTR